MTPILRFRPLALAALLLAAPLVHAQESPRIEQQMSHAEFTAAGLDQLTPAQLENLNRWLGRTLDDQTARAAQEAGDKARQEQRGLPGTVSRDPVTAQLQGGFDGFARGRSYSLDNGQVWRQTDGATLPGVSLESPQVRIAPSLIGSAWYLQVDGYNTRAKVERIK